MQWLHDVSYLFGGAFLTNAVPHFVSGVMGRPFQSPFAKPPGEGLSSSTVNVLWGFPNLVIGYLLVVRVGNFDLRAADHVVALGLGVLLIGVMSRALCSAASTAAIRRSTHDGMAKGTFRSLTGLQLPDLGRRRDRVQCRNMDAAHRPGLAGADRN